jgi:molybdopterin-guanine dinucleotide biosynthesis protein A
LTQTSEEPAGVLGVILAGGGSRRFGEDKALALLGGVPLVARVAERARPQVDGLVLSGRPIAGLDLTVVADRTPGEGPLAALSHCLAWAATQAYPFAATFPCDAPFFPADLVARLRREIGGADCVMARRRGQGHYAFGLWRTAIAPKLAAAVEGGLRSLREVDTVLARVYADFDDEGRDPFFNINRPEDLALAEAWLRAD